MNRTIKFRAWDGKQMHYSYIIAGAEYCNVLTILQDEEFAKKYYKVDEWKVMQFTGLLDCEGKEVFEGDLLSNNFGTDKEVVRQVIFQNGSWIMKRIKGKSRLGENILLGEYYLLNFKVIGNLCEHPNLLNNES